MKRKAQTTPATASKKLKELTLFEQLKENGYLVLEGMVKEKKLGLCREKLSNTTRKFPEFAVETDYPVLGGFSAFGNPASFHNKTVRQIRSHIYKKFVKLEICPKGDHLEQIIDRMMIREKRRTPSPESFHRDESKFALNDDIVLGGWVNLDDKPQYFSCVPGTHTAVRGVGGFAPIKEEEKKLYKQKLVKVEIPPGALIVFYEHIVHVVTATKLNYDSYRLFIGWRFTKSKEPLIPGLKSILNDQGVVTIKSGQIPPMYARLHKVNWIDRLVEFTKNLKDECKEDYTIKKTGKVVKIPQRFMKSLKEYNFKMYEPYTEEEIKQHLPQPQN